MSRIEPHGGDIEAIRKDIIRARRWAKQHFPTEGSDTLLDGPKFDVKFDRDTMTVSPKMYGKKFGIEFIYMLVWIHDNVYWKGRSPVTGQEIRLEVK